MSKHAIGPAGQKCRAAVRHSLACGSGAPFYGPVWPLFMGPVWPLFGRTCWTCFNPPPLIISWNLHEKTTTAVKLARSPSRLNCTSLAALISIVLCVYNINAETCNLQPITACHPIDGISPLSDICRMLTERVPDDRHHGRGAAVFLASFIAASLAAR